jgi:hypothetical protein
MTCSGLRFLFRARSGLWISTEQALFFLASFRPFRAAGALARAGARAGERARTDRRSHTRARVYARTQSLEHSEHSEQRLVSKAFSMFRAAVQAGPGLNVSKFPCRYV